VRAEARSPYIFRIHDPAAEQRHAGEGARVGAAGLSRIKHEGAGH
jgi:hypothetical protein